jgi:hypothetical protein
MFRQTLQVASALYVVGSAVLLMSCTTMMMTTPAGDPSVEAKVAGTPAQLAAFDKALQSIIGAEPLGCLVMVNGQVSACNVLQNSPVPPTATDLTYVFFGPHTFVEEKLGTAFNQVPKQFNPNLPTLTIRPIAPVAPDCSSLPQPCVAAPYCTQYGRCSKQQFPCAKC